MKPVFCDGATTAGQVNGNLSRLAKDRCSVIIKRFFPLAQLSCRGLRLLCGLLLAGCVLPLTTVQARPPVAQNSSAGDEASPVPPVPTAQDIATQIALAERMEHGEGVIADPLGALVLYCRLADQGNADAAAHIGWMFFAGRGIPRNDARAADWFTAAAERGHQQAGNLVRRFGMVATAAARCAPPRLVQDTSPPPPLRPPAALAGLVMSMSRQYGLDPMLVLTVIQVESSFQSDAVSPKGALGLMQVLPETGRRFGVADVWRVEDNLTAGMRYLRWLLSAFRGDVTLALAAYNAGEGRVFEKHGVPNFPETQAYVKRIHSYYPALTHPYDPKLARPAPFLTGP